MSVVTGALSFSCLLFRSKKSLVTQPPVIYPAPSPTLTPVSGLIRLQSSRTLRPSRTFSPSLSLLCVCPLFFGPWCPQVNTQSLHWAAFIPLYAPVEPGKKHLHAHTQTRSHRNHVRAGAAPQPHTAAFRITERVWDPALCVLSPFVSRFPTYFAFVLVVFFGYNTIVPLRLGTRQHCWEDVRQAKIHTGSDGQF